MTSDDKDDDHRCPVCGLLMLEAPHGKWYCDNEDCTDDFRGVTR